MDYAPCSVSVFGLFAISEFDCMRSCALFAQAAITCQVRVAAARQLPSPASTAAGGQHRPAPLLLLEMELIKVLRWGSRMRCTAAGEVLLGPEPLMAAGGVPTEGPCVIARLDGATLKTKVLWSTHHVSTSRPMRLNREFRN